ncbi:hypothetical protein [Marinagarivorans cellulosilyticus]|uniref:Uncharacterized protein n=1 Tax=Marinagarivorans cellulosilyticus TaxID=2721545 RepID=A0AAN1WJN7_9GAMM|nr:hypothetical protein [Marinagarivorans cellulosilyticus]BCD98848.1 hypothetical protein MARGE09_P3049 [Marinagarivorans cellulosilyticus]
MSAMIQERHRMCCVQTPLAIEQPHHPAGHTAQQVFSYYQKCLWQSSRAQCYLEERGLLDKALLQQFHIGFCDRTLHRQLPVAKSVAGQRARGPLRQLGLMRPSGRETFEGAIVVPALCNGMPLAAYGRRVTPKLASRCVPYIYWATQEAGLFNELVIYRHRHVYLCKTPIEALTLIKAGINNVVSCWGNAELTNNQWQQLSDAGLASLTVVINKGGFAQQFIEQLRSVTRELPVMLRYIALPKRCDLNAAWGKLSGDRAAFHSLLANARPYLAGAL